MGQVQYLSLRECMETKRNLPITSESNKDDNLDEDLSQYLTLSQKNKNKPVSKKTKELANELAEMLNYDEHKIKSLVMKYVMEYPNKSTEWRLEQAILELNERKSI
jgi:hypothetical protein